MGAVVAGVFTRMAGEFTVALGSFTMVAGAFTVAVEAISVETGQGRIVGAIEGGKSVDVIGVSSGCAWCCTQSGLNSVKNKPTRINSE